jgi:hypothetical protein
MGDRFSISDLQFAIEKQDGISVFQSQIDNRKSQILSIQPGARAAAKKPITPWGLVKTRL